MEYKNLTEEQKAKARSCKTPEELVELAKDEGYELTNEELEGISGGGWGDCYTKDCTDYTCQVVCKSEVTTQKGALGLM